MAIAEPITPKPKLSWYHPTPGKLLVILLAVEGVLLLSERWFPKGYAVLIAIASVGVAVVFMLLWFILALLFRWHFQFSLRSLLLLTVAVAVPFSWLAVRMNEAKRQKDTVGALLKKGLSRQFYDYQIDTPGPFVEGVPPPFPVWLRKMFGDDYFCKCVGLSLSNIFPGTPLVIDSDLEHLKELPDLRFIILANTGVTDNGLKHLEGLKNLKTLSMINGNVTNAGVAELQKALPNCKIEH